MPRRKLHKRHTRNILRVKKTYYVSIPIDIVRILGLRDRQKVEVRLYGKNKILIKDWKK